LKRDPDQARRLLAEAGFPGGQGLPVIHYLYTSRAETDDKIAVELQAMLIRELGIQIQLTKQEWAVYQDSLKNFNYDMARSSWIGDYKDPNTFLDMFVTGGGNNETGWGNARYDELIALASREPGSAKRFALFYEAETLLVDAESPICPLFNYVVIAFYDDHRLGGMQGNITDEHPFRAMYWKSSK
jgi:oligopeptide transport system substrate-binding protein